MSMSEWDRKYHFGKNPKLKATLFTIVIVIALFIGITITERIAFSMTFPASSEYIELDGCNFSAEITAHSYFYYYISGINLLTYANLNNEFPIGVNATRVWLIPTEGGIWPWTDYEILLLRFEFSTNECAHYSFIMDEVRISRMFVYFDAIVEVNSSQGDLYYISAESEFYTLQQ